MRTEEVGAAAAAAAAATAVLFTYLCCFTSVLFRFLLFQPFIFSPGATVAAAALAWGRSGGITRC